MKIEIIDPDEVSASLLGEILSRNGHAVGINTNTTRGSFASSDTDLVITESETGGFESLDILQAMRDHGHKAPWIIYRGTAPHESDLAEKLGADVIYKVDILNHLQKKGIIK